MQKVSIHLREGRQVVDKSSAVVGWQDSVDDSNRVIGYCEQLAFVRCRLIGHCVSNLRCGTACQLIVEIQLSCDWILGQLLGQL